MILFKALFNEHFVEVFEQRKSYSIVDKWKICSNNLVANKPNSQFPLIIDDKYFKVN